jgi:hypothetical protein
MTKAKKAAGKMGRYNASVSELTAARSKAPCCLTVGGRKKAFRATAGLTIDQQLELASQLQAQGDDVLDVLCS